MNRFLKDIKKYKHYTLYAAKSQLKAEVANSYLNWLWWILEPLCFMAMYAFVFGFLFSKKQENFHLYIFIGLAIWDFFNRCIKSSVRMVKRNKAIVAKVYIPKYLLMISDMRVNAFKMLICFGIVIIMMVIFRVQISYRIIFAVPIVLTAVVFTFGCCLILMHLGVFVDDMANLINIALRFFFYLTGIFYNIETSFPDPYKTILLKCNPLACLITALRHCVLYSENIDWVMLIVWFVISVFLVAFGIRIIYKSENTYVKVI